MSKTNTTFDHWDTDPVQAEVKIVKGKKKVMPIGSYQPEDYTGREWMVRKSVERDGDDHWVNSSALDFSEFDYL